MTRTPTTDLNADLSGEEFHSFAEVLASMPNVGEDEDFDRIDDAVEGRHVFD